MLTEALARKSQHDEDKVDAQSPETRDERDAHDAAALEDGIAKACTALAALSDCDGVLTGLHALVWLGNNVDF